MNYMLIDSHAHLNFNAFKDDWAEVVQNCLDNDTWLINIGSKYDNSKKAVEMAEKYDQGVYAAIGLHPINLETGLVKIKDDLNESVGREAKFDYNKYKELAKSEKVVAVGETGFDYYWRPKTTKKKELFKQKQKELFLKHLRLAQELDLPVILHCRMAHKDLIETLSSTDLKPKRAVAHSFVGTIEELERYLSFGFYIGFNGIIFKKIEGINFEEIIKKTPLERILIETDCPYLAPPQFQDERNTPLSLEYIVEKVAQIKNISFEEVAQIATQNAKKLFKL